MDSADPLCKYCGYTTESCLEIALGCWIEGTCLGQFNLAGDAHIRILKRLLSELLTITGTHLFVSKDREKKELQYKVENCVRKRK